MADADKEDAQRTPLETYFSGYFARRVVQPVQLPAIMRRHIYTGAMGNIWATLIGGLYLTYFGGQVGVQDWQWPVMAMIGSWGMMAQLVSTAVTHRVGQRKFVWFVCAVGDRLLRFLAIMLALILWQRGSHWAAWALIIGTSMSVIVSALASPPWLSWLADIIPPRQHGTFWGRRTAWIAISVVGVSIPVSLWFDGTPPEQKKWLVIGIFTAATIIGLLDLLIHGTIPEPIMPRREFEPFRKQILAPLKDREFRPWLVFTCFWNLSVFMAAPLVQVYYVKTLGGGQNMFGGMMVLVVVGLLGSIVTARWSGGLVDRLGIKRVLVVSYATWATLPIFWCLAGPTSKILWFTISSLLGGAIGTGADTAGNKLITRFPSPERREAYIAMSNSLTYLAAGAGSLLCAVAMKFLGNGVVPIAGVAVLSFHILFALSALMRLSTVAILLPRVKESPREQGV